METFSQYYSKLIEPFKCNFIQSRFKWSCILRVLSRKSLNTWLQIHELQKYTGTRRFCQGKVNKIQGVTLGKLKREAKTKASFQTCVKWKRHDHFLMTLKDSYIKGNDVIFFFQLTFWEFWKSQCEKRQVLIEDDNFQIKISFAFRDNLDNFPIRAINKNERYYFHFKITVCIIWWLKSE